jgi:transcription elongation factor GreA
MSTSGKFLFFQNDYSALLRQIDKLEADYKKWGKVSTEGKLGDWHDNFNYEEAMRQMGLLSRQIHDMKQILANAELVGETDRVGNMLDRAVVGSRVILRDQSGRANKYRISSYMVLVSDPDSDGYSPVSYVSPVGRAVIGKHLNDEAKFSVEGSQMSYQIVKIE